ncbi:MAG: T9SS type A sorting domain-containing protein [Bacteroidota bacterium]
MKTRIFVFFLFSFLLLCTDKLSAQSYFITSSVSAITAADTVVFDLSGATCSGNEIEFPVYINSDDAIYAIDFAMKFDLTKINYDSLTILKPYLNCSISYNNSDSTLRFSSFSGIPIENNIPLFNIRFSKMASSVDSIGFSDVSSYLNGDSCSNVTHEYIARPALIPAGPLNIYPGDSISLSVNAITGYSYEWSTGDTTTTILIADDGIYEVTATNSSGCSISSFIIINNGIPLPVELSYFKADIKNENVVLEWATFSEDNNDYFTIERSADGKNWISFNETTGAGNSNEFNRYLCIDKNPLHGENYYRLKQTDFNGETNYLASDVIFYTSKTDDAIEIYPNPFTDILQIAAHHDLVVQLFDGRGMPLTEEVKILQESNYSFSTQHLENGIYFLKIKDKNQVITVKVCRF